MSVEMAGQRSVLVLTMKCEYCESWWMEKLEEKDCDAVSKHPPVRKWRSPTAKYSGLGCILLLLSFSREVRYIYGASDGLRWSFDLRLLQVKTTGCNLLTGFLGPG